MITNYQLAAIYFNLCITQKYKGQKLKNIPKNGPTAKHFNNQFEGLIESGILTKYQAFSGAYSIFGKNIYTEEEIACSIDPFAYISHLSAMDYHGLTDRIPKILFISTPSQKNWKDFALKQMHKDLKENLLDYQKKKFPILIKIPMGKIGKKNVNQFSSKHFGAFKSIKDRTLRVSTIGRTFLDMLRKPDLCGGIYHVINIYKEFGQQYLNLIVDEMNLHGKPIDKVRAGYILEELCNAKHEAFEKWLQFAARGGSRKLDPTEEYSSTYSERWCLSINVEI
ncbi:MAG: hypothetical protein HF978_08580 [Desulfobacteraceae bacterium]|nr:hypothetical protein [Desulfobacteraceae bacterium]MBC2755587.1 hypothetical protein [Desulfobacteraceae bacterium]